MPPATLPVNFYITMLALSAPPGCAADSATLPCDGLLQIRGRKVQPAAALARILAGRPINAAWLSIGNGRPIR
jgi:hypothetical protein